jgi:hypothetical protein
LNVRKERVREEALNWMSMTYPVPTMAERIKRRRTHFRRRNGGLTLRMRGLGRSAGFGGVRGENCCDCRWRTSCGGEWASRWKGDVREVEGGFSRRRRSWLRRALRSTGRPSNIVTIRGGGGVGRKPSPAAWCKPEKKVEVNFGYVRVR